MLVVADSSCNCCLSNYRDRYQSGKSSGTNAVTSGANESQGANCQSLKQSKGNQQTQQQRFGKQRQRMRTASMPAENRRVSEERRFLITSITLGYLRVIN